ncbi:hypothetical protein ASF91_06530 [Rhizobium sp. Leaf155]|nr:hypothetical protein ASF91_06530 [Rhizobium sp. Leaf155]
MPPIDICLVAGRRPELLERTLKSFQASMFDRFEIANFYANIDPIFGDTDDEAATIAVIRSLFPNAHIHTPEQPGFCKAVKYLWQQARSEILFHLEDDWLLDEQLDPTEVFRIFSDEDVAQLSLNHYHKHWNFRYGHFHRRWERRTILGIRFKVGRPFPLFATSPSFLRTDFARTAASLMDDRYDPEKQFYDGINPAMEDFVRPYKNYMLGTKKRFLITDIGREWRDERKLTKTYVDGVSNWEKEG